MFAREPFAEALKQAVALDPSEFGSLLDHAQNRMLQFDRDTPGPNGFVASSSHSSPSSSGGGGLGGAASSMLGGLAGGGLGGAASGVLGGLMGGNGGGMLGGLTGSAINGVLGSCFPTPPAPTMLPDFTNGGCFPGPQSGPGLSEMLSNAGSQILGSLPGMMMGMWQPGPDASAAEVAAHAVAKKLMSQLQAAGFDIAEMQSKFDALFNGASSPANVPVAHGSIPSNVVINGSFFAVRRSDPAEFPVEADLGFVVEGNPTVLAGDLDLAGQGHFTLGAIKGTIGAVDLASPDVFMSAQSVIVLPEKLEPPQLPAGASEPGSGASGGGGGGSGGGAAAGGEGAPATTGNADGGSEGGSGPGPGPAGVSEASAESGANPGASGSGEGDGHSAGAPARPDTDANGNPPPPEALRLREEVADTRAEIQELNDLERMAREAYNDEEIGEEYWDIKNQIEQRREALLARHDELERQSARYMDENENYITPDPQPAAPPTSPPPPPPTSPPPPPPQPSINGRTFGGLFVDLIDQKLSRAQRDQLLQALNDYENSLGWFESAGLAITGIPTAMRAEIAYQNNRGNFAKQTAGVAEIPKEVAKNIVMNKATEKVLKLAVGLAKAGISMAKAKIRPPGTLPGGMTPAQVKQLDDLLGKGDDALDDAAKPGSPNAKGASAAESGLSGKGPVEQLEVGTYGDLAKRSAGDGLTPDHIPSFAAVRADLERQLGRPLTPQEARALRDNTNAIVIRTDTHQQASRTYGGRNSSSQIGTDATDLQNAFNMDKQALRERLMQDGHSAQAIDDAFRKLDELNRNAGRY